MSVFNCRQCGTENVGWKEDWTRAYGLSRKIKRVLAVLSEWPCPICKGEKGNHSTTCDLGKALSEDST